MIRFVFDFINNDLFKNKTTIWRHIGSFLIRHSLWMLLIGISFLFIKIPILHYKFHLGPVLCLPSLAMYYINFSSKKNTWTLKRSDEVMTEKEMVQLNNKKESY